MLECRCLSSWALPSYTHNNMIPYLLRCTFRLNFISIFLQSRQLQIREDLSSHRCQDDHLQKVRPGHCQWARFGQRMGITILHSRSYKSKIFSSKIKQTLSLLASLQILIIQDWTWSFHLSVNFKIIVNKRYQQTKVNGHLHQLSWRCFVFSKSNTNLQDASKSFTHSVLKQTGVYAKQNLISYCTFVAMIYEKFTKVYFWNSM